MEQQIPEHITSSYLKHVGLRNESIADLKVYLAKPVGVGEHGDIGEVVNQKLATVDKYDSLLATIQRLFPDVQEVVFGSSQPEPQAKQPEVKEVESPTGSSINGNSDEVFAFDKSKEAKITEEDLENSEG